MLVAASQGAEVASQLRVRARVSSARAYAVRCRSTYPVVDARGWIRILSAKCWTGTFWYTYMRVALPAATILEPGIERSLVEILPRPSSLILALFPFAVVGPDKGVDHFHFLLGFPLFILFSGNKKTASAPGPEYNTCMNLRGLVPR